MFKKFENFRNVVLLSLSISLSYVLIAYLINQESQTIEQCDKLIFLEGELSVDVRKVCFYSNGTATLYLCDGKTVRVPTNTIIKIADKDDQ